MIFSRSVCKSLEADAIFVLPDTDTVTICLMESTIYVNIWFYTVTCENCTLNVFVYIMTFIL